MFSIFPSCVFSDQFKDMKEKPQEEEDGYEEYDDMGDEDDREIIDEFEEESATEEVSETVLDNTDNSDSADNSDIVPSKLMYPEADPEQSNQGTDPESSRLSDQPSEKVRSVRKRQRELYSLPLNDSLQDDVDLIKRSMAPADTDPQNSEMTDYNSRPTR